jgi:hypothetical protein
MDQNPEPQNCFFVVGIGSVTVLASSLPSTLAILLSVMRVEALPILNNKYQGSGVPNTFFLG